MRISPRWPRDQRGRNGREPKSGTPDKSPRSRAQGLWPTGFDVVHGRWQSPEAQVRGRLTLAWKPASRFGRCAILSAAAFLLLLVTNAIVQSTTAARSDAVRPWLVWPMLAAAVAAAVLALVAILREKDRSVWTFVALVPLAFSLLFELIFE